MTAAPRIAVVTGANRGLGFATARALGRAGHRVVLGSRSDAAGERAAQLLVAEGIDASSHTLDVTSDASVDAFAAHLERVFGQVDVLVNNAGVFVDPRGPSGSSILDLEPARLEASMATNFGGCLRMCQRFAPPMRARNFGRIVNVSSFLGQFATMGAGFPAYRISKLALNAITRMLGAEFEGSNVLVNSVCPGRVRTDMGGPDAPQSPEEGADTIVWLAMLPEGGPNGGFFRERAPIPW